MEFILDEAEQDGPKLQFSDEEDATDGISDFKMIQTYLRKI